MGALLDRRSKLPRRALATGLAACAHLVVLLLLGWKIPRLIVPSRNDDDSAAIEVTLVRQEPRQPASAPTPTPTPTPPRRPAPPAPAAPPVLTAPSPAAPPLPAPQAVSPAPVPSNTEGSTSQEHLRNALRGLLACSNQTSLHLTSEERAACDRRLAATVPGPGKSLSADELAQFNADKQESILTRKPVKGCLPRLGDHPQPGAGAGSGGLAGAFSGRPHSASATTAGGVGCSWSF